MKDRKYRKKRAMWCIIAGWKKLKRDKRRYFATCVESSDCRRVVRWKRANDNVAWSERAFVRYRGHGSEKQAKVGNGYSASSVVTKRRVTSFGEAAWRERTGIRRNYSLSVIVRWKEIYRIRCEYETIEQAYVVDCARSIAFVRTRKVNTLVYNGFPVCSRV